ncbi:MAG: dipeptidyl peptidase 3, partial [Paramuribaculum sp.]|nr:dipeptidyl peptidase 3 [Paramuribaculum sp.]
MEKIKTATLAIAMAASSIASPAMADDFNYVVDRFADIQVLRYKVPDFESLSLRQKMLVYHLTEAALAGRDILWDQNNRYNLALRKLLENIYSNYSGDRNSDDYKAFETYLKQVWFANGNHHHYSMDKFRPAFSRDFMEKHIAALPADKQRTDKDQLLRYVFDPSFMPKKVNQVAGQDLILTSAVNLYDGVTQAEVEQYFAARKDSTDLTPVMHGLNTRVVKDADGNIVEQTYKVGGVYSDAISRIVDQLEKARDYAENPVQASVIDKLIAYYRSGDLKDFDDYSIQWVGDTGSRVDFINGFIESYDDPLGMTGSWESIVNFKNLDASHRTEAICSNAQWFEDHSPVDPRFRKDKVQGVTAKVITAAILAGDAYPATPIGINLPNSNWIRANHGSKSVTIENITQAYDAASHGNGFNEEFVPDAATRALIDKYLFDTDNLHTDLHECLGHGSG